MKEPLILNGALTPDALESDFVRDLFDRLDDGVYFVDTDRRVTYWNAAAEQITGFGRGDVIGRACRANLLLHTDENGRLLCDAADCPAARSMSASSPRAERLFLRHRDGYRVPIQTKIWPVAAPDGTVIGAVELFHEDRSRDGMARQLQILKQQAMLDELTGIGNRRYAQITLDRCFSRRGVHGTTGVLFVDIDHFKNVNDTYGHEAGDEVLVMVARTIQNSVRPQDRVARWGGEEFLVILEEVTRHEMAEVAERLRGLVEASVAHTPRGDISVTVSVGGACCQEADTQETIITRADRRLYRAKEAGRNRVICSSDCD